MKVTVDSLKRNAIKAIFVMLAVVGGFAIVMNMEIAKPQSSALDGDPTVVIHSS